MGKQRSQPNAAALNEAASVALYEEFMDEMIDDSLIESTKTYDLVRDGTSDDLAAEYEG